MSEKKDISPPNRLNQAAKPEQPEQEVVRRQKMEKLRQAGVDLFPHKVHTTHLIGDIVSHYSDLDAEELEAQQVEVFVPGRIISIRKMGRSIFFHINDSQGKLQAYLREDKIGKEKFELFSLFDIGDMVAVRGVLFKTRTGELTVLVESYTFLAKCLHPLPEKWHGLQDVELRYRKRYLDLIVNSEVADIFRLRSRMITHIREYFNSRDYIEVETPMMHSIPGGALAKPFKTFHNALGIELYLRIAPELFLKRLTVGGMGRVYEINRNFRNEGLSSEHNPEFTMLEFYEAYADYNDMITITEELIQSMSLTLLDKEKVTFGNHEISFQRPWKKIKYMEALVQLSGLAPSRFDDRAGIIEFAASLAGEGADLSYAKALDVIFDKNVKPQLIQPTFVLNPPKEISPFAKASPENPEETERFELVVAGMEIANAFSELSDPADQKSRFEQQAEERKKGNEESHMIDEDYVHALEYGLPPAGGEGIGIDRLVMIFANCKSIREVILFPLLRPR